MCALLRTPPLPIPSLFPSDTLQMLLRGMEMPTGVAQGRWIVALAIRAKTSPALPPAAESLLWIGSRGMLKPGYVFCVRRDAGYTHTARLVPWQIVGDYVALLHGICCRMRKSATLQRERGRAKTAAEHDCILYSVHARQMLYTVQSRPPGRASHVRHWCRSIGPDLVRPRYTAGQALIPVVWQMQSYIIRT